MDRKQFLKNGLGLAGIAAVAPVILRAENFLEKPENLNGNKNLAACSVTNTETEGPFPTKTPASYVRSNIVGDRTGVAFTMNIYIKNTNGNCAAYQGVLVDIWHCDKDGNYSQYGGTTMQSTDYTAYNFLRGRQTTDANGLVSFTSIFPGWYQSRATHIHVHVYKADGTSLLVTQIAFPEGTSSAVYNVNTNGSSYGYTKGMSGYTYNASDNVFSDGVTNELSTVTGSLSAGYVLTHTIYVAGAALATEETNAVISSIGQNFPNPFVEETSIPLRLKQRSTVSVTLYDFSGRKVRSIAERQSFAAGEQMIRISRNGMKAGVYLAKVDVENAAGKATETIKISAR